MKSKILLFFLFYSFSLMSFELFQQAEIDLNFDGKKESISTKTFDDGSSYLLYINELKIKGKFEDGECDGFAIFDIDTSDKYKEIAVHTPGPSDDDVYVFYYYDGKAIYKMGELSRWPKINGNGIVYVKDWMGFWEKNDKYVLNKQTRKLDKIPQEFYYVGVKATVKKSFPIYKTREFKDVVANLKENSEITILVCDVSEDFLKYSYLIKSETNLIGWCRGPVLFEHAQGLPLAD